MGYNKTGVCHIHLRMTYDPDTLFQFTPSFPLPLPSALFGHHKDRGHQQHEPFVASRGENSMTNKSQDAGNRPDGDAFQAPLGTTLLMGHQTARLSHSQLVFFFLKTAHAIVDF